MDEFVEKYNGRDVLCLSISYVSFGGSNRLCCDFLFTSDTLKKEFTAAMIEKYGDRLVEKWLFYQRNDNGQVHFPDMGSPCFDLEKGDISGLQRMLSDYDKLTALKMVLAVAKEMGIEVVSREPINLKEHTYYGDKLKYKYEQVVAPGGNNNVPKK